MSTVRYAQTLTPHPSTTWELLRMGPVSSGHSWLHGYVTYSVGWGPVLRKALGLV